MTEAYDVHVFENRNGDLCASATLPSGERTPATRLIGTEIKALTTLRDHGAEVMQARRDRGEE